MTEKFIERVSWLAARNAILDEAIEAGERVYHEAKKNPDRLRSPTDYWPGYMDGVTATKAAICVLKVKEAEGSHRCRTEA